MVAAGPGSAWRETRERSREVGDENEQRPLIGGFLSRFAGSGGNEEGTGRKEDEGGGVNLDGRASRFRRRGGWGHGTHPAEPRRVTCDDPRPGATTCLRRLEVDDVGN